MPISSVEYTNPMLRLQNMSVVGMFFGLINVTEVCDVFRSFHCFGCRWSSYHGVLVANYQGVID